MSTASFFAEKEAILDQTPERGRACFFQLADLTAETDGTKTEAKELLTAWTKKKNYRWAINDADYVSVIRDPVVPADNGQMRRIRDAIDRKATPRPK